ncbi:hypothetical protein PVAG01_09249 [Phlyctema vagabunda]|uniref:Restriction of telomere capping protein 4 n=1 Tax=Phlyctema vagabunda TaxID=108571 RepID=A0ABR4P6T9_9HELO
MATRERSALFQNLNLIGSANVNAPYKPLRPTMPQPGMATREFVGKKQPRRPTIDPFNEHSMTAIPGNSDDEDEDEDGDDDSANIGPTTFARKAAEKKSDNRLQAGRDSGKRGANKSPITITDSPGSPNQARKNNTGKVGEGMNAYVNRSRGYRFGWSGSKKNLVYGAGSRAGGTNFSQGRKRCDTESPEPVLEDVELVEQDIKSSPVAKFDKIEFEDLDSPQKEIKFQSIDSADVESPKVTSYSGKKTKGKAKPKRAQETSDDEKFSGFKIPEGLDASLDDVLQEPPVRVKSPPLDIADAKRRKLNREALLDELPEYVKNIVKEDGYENLLDEFNIPGNPTSSAGSSKQLCELDYKPRSGQPICPVCMEPVELDDLKSWGDMKGFNQQSKFCRFHQKKTAEVEWNEKGYPRIDWQGMNKRIRAHHKFIKDLVKGAPCHYRTVLDDAIKSGKNRTLKDMSQSLVPGYYGSRGLKVISENIMSRFPKLLKERAVKDRLIAARGVPSFVQAVLVLEVGCAFIMEDMDISAEDARDVLSQSIAIGELVNEEVKDVLGKRYESEDDEE